MQHRRQRGHRRGRAARRQVRRDARLRHRLRTGRADRRNPEPRRQDREVRHRLPPARPGDRFGGDPRRRHPGHGQAARAPRAPGRAARPLPDPRGGRGRGGRDHPATAAAGGARVHGRRRHRCEPPLPRGRDALPRRRRPPDRRGRRPHGGRRARGLRGDRRTLPGARGGGRAGRGHPRRAGVPLEGPPGGRRGGESPEPRRRQAGRRRAPHGDPGTGRAPGRDRRAGRGAGRSASATPATATCTSTSCAPGWTTRPGRPRNHRSSRR